MAASTFSLRVQLPQQKEAEQKSAQQVAMGHLVAVVVALLPRALLARVVPEACDYEALLFDHKKRLPAATCCSRPV